MSSHAVGQGVHDTGSCCVLPPISNSRKDLTIADASHRNLETSSCTEALGALSVVRALRLTLVAATLLTGDADNDGFTGVRVSAASKVRGDARSAGGSLALLEELLGRLAGNGDRSAAFGLTQLPIGVRPLSKSSGKAPVSGIAAAAASVLEEHRSSSTSRLLAEDERGCERQRGFVRCCTVGAT